MQKIRTLSQHIVSQIAAGEVIERPSYAVKELIENSVDADATVIEVHVQDSGLKSIRVVDNGSGMSKEDLKICFLPHTTSKLTTEDGLQSIKTLGFRGEALASVARISDLIITTRRKKDVGGLMISVKDGIVDDIVPIGTPIGTIVTIENLFLNIPVRKKFLKTPKTEFRHITETVMSVALAYPAIHFVLTHNKKQIFDLPSSKSDERIKALLGTALYKDLLPVSFIDGYMKIHGFIGRPQVSLKNNVKQFLFVNNRLVHDRMIYLSVKEAFGSLLPSSSTPVFLLNLILPLEVTDVNVHPRKEQISFQNSRTIFDCVKQAVSETLSEHNLTFRLAKFRDDNSARISDTTSYTGSELKKTISSQVMLTTQTKGDLLILNNTYVITLTPSGLLLLDQHAAHERIIYEELVSAYIKKKKKRLSYLLPKPLIVELSFSDSQIFFEMQEDFKNLGFGIDHFQGTSFQLRSIPEIFRGRNIAKIIQDMLIDLQQGGILPLDFRSQRMLAFLACRSAVKAGESLAKLQIKKLLNSLEKTSNNTTCPHGRPTMSIITEDEIAQFFKR